MEFNPDRKARIIIVDDHPMVREGMGLLINREPDMHACCEADQIEQALNVNRLCPHDLAIVDMTLEGFSGLEMIRRFQFEFPDLPILVVSMHAESIYADPALKAGARGYLMKQTATGELLTAIKQVLQGKLYLSHQMRSRISKQSAGLDSSISRLSSAELEVLHLIGMGLGTSEIAERVARSVKTIESHKLNMKRKLDLENSHQLTMFAINFVSLGRL